MNKATAWMAAATVAAALAACGSDDSSGTSADGGSHPDATSTADASSSDAAAASDGSGAMVTGCLSGSAPGMGPTAACTSFEQCAQSTCGQPFQAAFGADWASGTVTGACSGFYACASAGGCSQGAIAGCESSISGGCALALAAVNVCLQDTCTTEEMACNESLGGLIPTDGGGPGSSDASSDAADAGDSD